MSTRGYATVLGLQRDGDWNIRPDASALNVLQKAMKSGQPIEVRIKMPKPPKLKLRR